MSWALRTPSLAWPTLHEGQALQVRPYKDGPKPLKKQVYYRPIYIIVLSQGIQAQSVTSLGEGTERREDNTPESELLPKW